MRRIAANLLSGFAILLLSSCGKPSTRSISETNVIGKWSLAELETHKGNRGPAAGAIQGQMELRADGSFSAWLQWAKELTGKEQPLNSYSGGWSLSNNFLVGRLGTNATPKLSKLWFDNEFLALEPQATPRIVYYYKKVEERVSPTQ